MSQKSRQIRNANREIVLLKRITDSYWVLVGPGRPPYSVPDRETGVRMSKDEWENYYLDIHGPNGEVDRLDFRLPNYLLSPQEPMS